MKKEKAFEFISIASFRKLNDKLKQFLTGRQFIGVNSTEPTHAEKMAAFYRVTEGLGENFYAGIKMERSYKEQILDVFVSALNKLKADRVLDIASGTGEATAYLEAAGMDVSSVDISAAATATQHKFHPERKIAQADASVLPFAAGSFDGIHFKDGLVHIPDKNLFFAEMLRLLRPHGLLVVVSANGHGNESAPSFFTNTQETLEAIAKSGLKLVKHNIWEPTDPNHDWYGDRLSPRNVWWLQKPDNQ